MDEPDLSDYEPQVTLSVPSDPGLSPVEAVEEFIGMLEGGMGRLYAYVVQYGPHSFTVDMDTIPPTVTKAADVGQS